MYDFKRILVCLDLTETDDIIMKSVSTRAKYFNVDHITFIHVAESLELPKEITHKYPDLLAPIDETIEKLIEDKIAKFAQLPEDVEYDIEIVEGKPYQKILKWSSIKEVDVIVLGRKGIDEATGVLTEKVARLAECSVIIVPKKIELKSTNKLLIPTDFSHNSKMALEVAASVSKMYNADVICAHTFKVPTGYHATGKSYEEFANIMKENSQKDFNLFMKEHFPEMKTECMMLLDESNNPSKLIHDLAVEIGADFIVMGSKGRTGLSSILLGSVTEKMIKYDHDIPLLIVKDKSEQFGFLDALKKV